MIQDPVWEQSFPDVAGIVVPFETGLVRFSQAEVARRREENEARRRDLLARPPRARPRPGARLLARAAGRPLLLPQLGRPAALHTGSRVRAAVLALAALVLLAAGCGEEDAGTAPPPGRFVATSRALTPTAHLFGEPVEARVDVVVDRRRLDPDAFSSGSTSCRTGSSTAASGVAAATSPNFSRVRFELTLRCLTIRCVPSRIASVLGAQEGRGERRTYRFKPARVVYDDPKTGEVRHLRRVVVAAARRDLGLSATPRSRAPVLDAFAPGAEFKSTVTPVLEPLPAPAAAPRDEAVRRRRAPARLPGHARSSARSGDAARSRRPSPSCRRSSAPSRSSTGRSSTGNQEERREALEALAFELRCRPGRGAGAGGAASSRGLRTSLRRSG